MDTPIFARVQGNDDLLAPKENADGGYEYTKSEVKAGTVILMHSNLTHMSEANQSAKSRIACNYTVVNENLEWRADNYLRPYESEAEFEQLVPAIV